MKNKNAVGKRALAHIETIDWIKPIEGADNIELIGILGWTCIAKIGEFAMGDRAVYIEIDSKVPENDERFSFLAKKHYKIKTMKLGKFNVYSQGIALPATLFPEISNLPVGADVTDALNITYALELDNIRKDDSRIYKSIMARHKKLFALPFIKWVMGHEIGRHLALALFGTKHDKKTAFPSWIKKTDETRIENAPFYLDSKEQWTITEKLDGTSCTYVVRKKWNGYEFYVCSRNRRIIDEEQECYHNSNIYWELANKYDIKNKLITFAKEYNYKTVVLQGEGIGLVQGNPYGLTDNDLYIFNLITDGNRWGSLEMAEWCQEQQVRAVPIVNKWAYLPETIEGIKKEADGQSAIAKVKREGLVYRSLDGSRSFKNVSREYLLRKE